MDLSCKQESPKKLCGLTSRARNTTILLRALNLTQKQCQLFAGLQGDNQIKPNIVDIKNLQGRYYKVSYRQVSHLWAGVSHLFRQEVKYLLIYFGQIARAEAMGSTAFQKFTL